MEMVVNTLIEILLNKAKGTIEKSMLGRIRDNKHVKCVGNKTNPSDNISLLPHKDGIYQYCCTQAVFSKYLCCT